MATLDRMRVVELRNTQAYTVLDLMDGANFTHIKGQFQTVRPQKTRSAITGSRRFDGDRIAFEKMGNAALQAQWLIGPPGTTPDAAMANVEHLGQVFEDATRQGRLIEVRLVGTTKSVFYEPRGTPDWSLQNYDAQQFIANGVLQATATIPVAPLAYGAPMDVEDHFDQDTIASGDWIKDGVGTLTVSGDSLVPGGTGSGNRARYRHARGYPYTDCEIRLTCQLGTSTISGGRWGIFMAGNQSGIDTKLALEADAATGQAQLVTYFAGTRTVVQNFAVTLQTQSWLYLRMLRIGDLIWCHVADSAGILPSPSQFMSDFDTANYHAPFALAGAQLGLQRGDCGIDITPADVGEAYDDWYIRPYSYYQIGTPEQVRLSNIPGTAPAVADFEITTNDAGAVGQAPIWATLGWSERPTITNLCRNGDFESNANDTVPWSHAALTNYITNAATSHGRDTTSSRYGIGEMTVITPASTQSGVSHTINQRLKANRQYAAWCWMKSAAQTTSMAIKLGGIGAFGNAIGPAKAISGAWQLYSVTFRSAGSTDADGIVVAMATQAATATTFEVDAVNVVEVGTVTLAAAITSASATTLQVYSCPATEVPNRRPDGTLSSSFTILIDQEMIQVTAISADGLTWTVNRGVTGAGLGFEGTTAATHTVDTPVIICPPFRPQFEGKGAQPAFGVIEGEQYAQNISVATGSGTVAVQANTAARGQQVVHWGATSGGTLALYYYVDPNTLVADDFTQGEVDIEVFGRVQLPPLATTATTILTTAEPTEHYNSLILAGRSRGTREFGQATKSPIVNLSSGAGWRLMRLGTIPMVVDRTNPQRWRLKLFFLITAAADLYVDYLWLGPVGKRACLPTGKVDDGGVTYPSFLPPDPNWGLGSAMTKIFRSDGSSLIRNPLPATPQISSLNAAFPDHGMGKQIILPTGDVDLYTKISDTIPDDPSLNTVTDMSGGTSANWICTLRAMVTPRYYVGRGGA